ncbi:hypothetical protein A9Z42_0054530 [Trichoderma parareesei]|uniref:Uncharacterized protein n=1 Tax=Trichoderma parareesei TaxID=858221 RepID=A0A2H3A0H5_TRIPA|nr:hypothetical protein A9Z42_0054530 [Trichoderma parareesei]
MCASPPPATTGPPLSSPEKPAPEAAAPGVVVVVVHDEQDDDDDDDDYRAHVLDAEDAAQFDELGGAFPVPEGADVVGNSFFGINNEASNIAFVLLLDKTEVVLQLLQELSDGSSSAGDSDEDDEDEDGRSLGYLSGGC